MLKSKLLTVFIAFALLITVGGVYATWSYAGSNLTDIIVPQSVTVTATIEDPTVSGAPGKLELTNNDLEYHINNDGDFNTVLGTSGGITVAYTPNPGSDYQTVNLICTVELTTTQYTGKDIFKLNNTVEKTITLNKENVASDAAAWTITDADIALALTEAFKLDKVAEHNAFKQALAGTHLEIDFSVDLTTPQN